MRRYTWSAVTSVGVRRYWFSDQTIATFPSRRALYTSSRNHDLCRNSIACGYLPTSSARRYSSITLQWESNLIDGGSWGATGPHFCLSSFADASTHPTICATPFCFLSWG